MLPKNHWIVGALFLAWSGQAVGAPPPVAQAPGTEAQLKSALVASLPKLGPLEPWQKLVFEDEVVAHYQRFIKDYRPSASGLTVVVDLDHLKSYLKFHAAPPAKHGERQFVLVHLEPAASCSRCAQAQAAIKSMVAARLERRGFSPLWIDEDEAISVAAGAAVADEKALDQKWAAAAESRKAVGALVLGWRLQAVEDVESTEEDHYLIHLFVTLKGVGHDSGQLELLDTDSFEVSAQRLLTDSFTDLGAKMEQEPVTPGTQGLASGVVLIDVTGIRDFAHFRKVWANLSADFLRAPPASSDASLNPLNSIDPTDPIDPWNDPNDPLTLKKLARGRATFAFRTSQAIEELKGLVDTRASRPGEGFTVTSWTQSPGASLQLEAR